MICQCAGSQERPPLKRLAVIVNRETDEALEKFMLRKGVTKTEALRRLVLLGAVMDQADANGEEILFTSSGVTEHVRII